MLAETYPGSRFITDAVASASSSARRCCCSGLTVKTLTRVTTSWSVAIVAIGLPPGDGYISVLILYQHAAKADPGGGTKANGGCRISAQDRSAAPSRGN